MAIKVQHRSGGGRAALDLQLVEPFIDPFTTATKTVFEMQAQTPVMPGKIYLLPHDERIPMEIVGLIGLTCAEFKGTVSICFRAEVFLKIYENMVGESHRTISQEIEDAAGELLNIIFGLAKTILNDQKGYMLELAIPTVLTGEKLQLHHQNRSSAVVLPFESGAGAFHLEILIEHA